MLEESFKNSLKLNNYSVTPERLYIFQTLKSFDGPCPVSQLINNSTGEVDKSTIYRTLDLFEKLGITNRVYNGWKYKIELSEMFNPHHHHMTCTNCGKVVSFHESKAFVNELKHIEKQHGFKTTSHSFELKGLCNNCC